MLMFLELFWKNFKDHVGFSELEEGVSAKSEIVRLQDYDIY